MGFPSRVYIRHTELFRSVRYTMSLAIEIPWAKSNAPLPQALRKWPFRSKMTMGGSLRWKPYTRSWESVATALTMANVSPGGSFAQSWMTVYVYFPLPTVGIKRSSCVGASAAQALDGLPRLLRYQ